VLSLSQLTTACREIQERPARSGARALPKPESGEFRTESVEDMPARVAAAAAAGFGGASAAGAWSKRLSSTFVVIFLTPRPPPDLAGGFLTAPKRGLAAVGFLAAAVQTRLVSTRSAAMALGGTERKCSRRHVEQVE
jgi:hypothetical protein